MKARHLAWPAGVLVLVVAAVPVAIVSIGGDEVGVVEGRLRPCPSSPNCVCSEFPGEAASIEPLSFSGEPAAAFASLVDFLGREPRVELVTVEDDYVHAVFRTPLMRYRDDVEFRLDAAAGVVHVRSASRLGYSDMGANRRRVESLRARWKPTGS